MTPDQLAASDPSVSVWVSASAGTGKTKVLTDRVLRLLLSKVSPSKILCLTFTKAAAAEMSNRINNELANWVIIDQSKLNTRLTELMGIAPTVEHINLARKLFIIVLDTPDNLKIQTIHSFCQSLLQKFPIEAGISSNYKVIDEATSLMLLQEAKLNLYSFVATNPESELAEAIRYISWNAYESSFNELIRDITVNQTKITRIFSNFNFQFPLLIDNLYTKLGLNVNDSEKTLLDNFIKTLNLYNESIQKIASALHAGTSSEKDRADILYNWLNTNLDDKHNIFDDFKYLFLTKTITPRKIISKALLNKHFELDAEVKQIQDLLLSFVEHFNSLNIAIRSKYFLRLAYEFLVQYNILKSKKSVLDYADLITITNNLLSNNNASAWILYKLDGGIDHILIDEAQDTSKEQWQIIENLTSEFFSGISSKQENRTLFVVGDEKQSIFSFQGADPLTFSYMHNYYKTIALQSAKSFSTINLEISFRSAEPVLNLVDNIFNDPELKRHISQASSEISHLTFRNLDAGSVELWPLVTVDNDFSDETPWQLPITRKIRHHSTSKLAELIASYVENWLLQGRVLKSKNRPITAGDIIILVRKRNDFTDYLVKELKKKNIAVAGIDRMYVTEHIAVMDLIALANFLLLPQDDLNLACLLKSPLIGFNEEDLMELAIERVGNLWEALKTKATYNLIFNSAYLKLADLLKVTDYKTPFALFNYVLEVKGGRKKFCARLGLEANDPLDEFLNLALNFQKNNIPSLQGFINWLTTSKIEIKRDLEQGKDQIRIMTVHSSKGLQAPIVILPDTTSLPLSKNVVMINEEDDILLWPGSRENYNNYCNNLKNDSAKAELSEYYRLLYVALTRAEDELIICGYKGTNALPQGCWYNMIKDAMKKLSQPEQVIINDNLIPFLDDQKLYRIKSEQKAITQSIPNLSESIEQIHELPDFVISKPPLEPIPPSPLIASSRVIQRTIYNSPSTQNKTLEKGTIIHKLLELLPFGQDQNQSEFITKFLNKYAAEFSTEELYQIKQNCLNILTNKAFNNVFGPNARSEVPITGMIDNKFLISGQIDRLIINDNDIYIIDFKSNVSPPLDESYVAVEYLRQMAAYRILIKQIYPKHNIICALIWTQTPSIMFLSDLLLDQQSLTTIID
jgi:ATP-dependent helicase/nuclease subunit A